MLLDLLLLVFWMFEQCQLMLLKIHKIRNNIHFLVHTLRLKCKWAKFWFSIPCVFKILLLNWWSFGVWIVYKVHHIFSIIIFIKIKVIITSFSIFIIVSRKSPLKLKWKKRDNQICFSKKANLVKTKNCFVIRRRGWWVIL